MAAALISTLLAWGALSFGAVYQWAYWPAAAAVVGMALWTARCWPRPDANGITAALGLLVLAFGCQVAPLSVDALTRLSSGAAAFLAIFDVSYGTGARPTHALSIAPEQTVKGLTFFVLGAMWTLACATVFRERASLRSLARNLAIVAAVVAILGLAQKATFNGKLLWFWDPTFYATNGFGPLVNRNHFAGWMMLALAVSVGCLFGMLARRAQAIPSSWRERLLWLGSPQASPVVLTAAAVLVMACSLVWTMSRSGIAAAAVSLTILAAAALYRSRGHLHRFVLAGFVVFTMMGVVGWRGADTLANWYGNTSTLEWRIQLWKDTLPALRDFWLTGSGLNTYGTLMLVYPRSDMTVHPREAHNDYLQLAVEGGVLVCVPVFLLIVAVGREILRRLKQPQDEMTWWIRMGAVAGICGMAVQELTEFSLQIPGVALLFATCVAIAIHEPVSLPERRPRERRAAAEELVTTI